MKHFRKAFRATGLLLTLTAIFALGGCKSAPGPISPPTPEAAPEPVPVPEPEPFLIAWAGTTWIFRDVPEGDRDFPGYRGFHLGRDGKLLLINLDTVRGDSWNAEGNHLVMSLREGGGISSLPVDGSFLAFIPDDAVEGDTPQRVRLVPESSPDAEGIILDLAKVNIDVIENHWIPRRQEEGDSVMWPMNREIHLMLLPDATGGLGILGYGGENRFRGDISLGTERFSVGPLAITRRIGPASDYENLYVRRIAEAERYVQVDDDLFLYADTRPVAGFRVRLFD